MYQLFPKIYASSQQELPSPHREGSSREGRSIPAYRFGSGKLRISLIAGCHADEPTGPFFLRKLVNFLHSSAPDTPWLQNYNWWTVPHANPDGEAVNKAWYSEEDTHFNLAKYLKYMHRALPGADIEFGFPQEDISRGLGPENRFIYDFWRSAEAPFHLHASLHSIGVTFGPWFLLDPHWIGRTNLLQNWCRQAVQNLGYPLFDIDRKGQKGFTRIAEGFCTRPNHRSMQAFFEERNDPATASKFHPSSMESIRSLGGDCLTLVSEMPLFLIPKKHTDLSWPNPLLDQWAANLAQWKMDLHTKKLREQAVNEEAHDIGLLPMPVKDQMQLQWRLITAGMKSLEE